jgi:hypothetical protein
MQISYNDWQNFRKKLSAIDKKAEEEMASWLQNKGGLIQLPRNEIIDRAYALATKYGEASASLSALMYDSIAELSGVRVPPAEVADTVEYGEMAKAVNGILKNEKSDKVLAQSVGKYTKRAGADTMLKNANRDGAEFAWVPGGDGCAFCEMLASRGWQHQSKAAMEGDHAEHIHANCDCSYTVRFDKNTNVKGYDPEKYLKKYYDAEGDTPQEKLNSMRRIQYQENKDKINAQKRASYAEKNNTFLLAAQSGKESKVPAFIEKKYDDYNKLKLDEKEKEVLTELHKLALENHYEYGKIIFNEGETEVITAELYNKVYLPINQTKGTGLKAFHSHTNDTPPSTADLVTLTVEKVEKIGVISGNGDTWIVTIGNGYRPTKKELIEISDSVRKELEEEMINYPGMKELTPEEMNYMLIREKFFRITRHFKWDVMGGDINDAI